MFDAMYVGAAGMRGQQLLIDTIAHNLANVNTVGFRRGVASFSEVVAALQAIEATDAASGLPQPAMRGGGVVSTLRLSSAIGELKQTGEPLDLAIDGAGFLEVVRADGTPAYTRAGHLRINEDRLLATTDGSPLAARIEIPADAQEVRIHETGAVTAVLAGDSEAVEVGQLELVTFPDAGALTAIGMNLYTAPTAAGEPQIAQPGEPGIGLLRQGFVEASNVQLADEMVSLMVAQRAFELNARVVQAADQMLSITNGLYR